ncbi:MAG: UbiH/UbiF/VisC/COQ6 family ubiquinone biosynthesis hydroxylase [Gammaproteobacteria bacterium]|nr:UbiH/UbiF/VisC/COQ6 family ubiquinone biosynthesis hydroxylase [Gammaproteobacteria bacterium]
MNSGCDLAVAGAGPVGLALALAGVEAGFTVRVLDRAAPTVSDAEERRYYALSPASVAWLRSLGAGDALRDACPYSHMTVWENDPRHGLEFDAGDVGRAELGWIVGHGALLGTLLRRLPSQVLCAGAELVSMQRQARGLTLQCAGGLQLRARLAVAADGAESSLRRLSGLVAVGWDYDQLGLVANVRPQRSHRHTAWQRFLPSGPLALLPLADGRCSIVWSADSSLAKSLLTLDDGAFAQRLTEASQSRLGEIVAVGPRLAFPLRLRHAPLYAADGIALVGDAAHVVHPLAGQGLNLGLADATALIETLVEARTVGRCWHAARQLERYSRMRKADTLRMMALTDALVRLYRTDNALFKILRREGLGLVGQIRPLRTFLARQASL